MTYRMILYGHLLLGLTLVGCAPSTLNLSGQVCNRIDMDQPVDSVMVRAVEYPKRTPRDSLMIGYAVTDANGRFELKIRGINKKKNRYKLIFDKELISETRNDVDPFSMPDKISLSVWGAIRGKVINRITEDSVQAYLSFVPTSSGSKRNTYCKEDGSFEMNRLKGNMAYRIEIDHIKYVPAEAFAQVKDGEIYEITTIGITPLEGNAPPFPPGKREIADVIRQPGRTGGNN